MPRPEALYGAALDAAYVRIVEMLADGIQYLSEQRAMAEKVQTKNPYSRYQRAQHTFDGLERQRDAALIAYIQQPSVTRLDQLMEAMGRLRSARRELSASIVSLMYFVQTQDQIGEDEARGALEQVVKAHEQRIGKLEAQAQERAA